MKFLRDTPSDEDFFGSHSLVAEAIADVICSPDDINIVGLLGSWGSGKSTVVRQVEKSLCRKAETVKTHVFTYDAWLHQNDPPRRAFLEALIGDLAAGSLLKEADWDPRLADLTGRSEETRTTTTRQLSTTGKWIFASLALVPAGLGLIDFDLLKEVFGASPSPWPRWVFALSLALACAPLLVVASFYFAWRPWCASMNGAGLLKAMRTWSFWREHNEAHKNESILSLLTNQSVEISENKTRISPEPTAIEFRSVFREVLKSLLKKDTRIVIVIDNLDRLAEADAMQLWATIRSLFLGRQTGLPEEPSLRPPAIILPIDEGAIERMFSRDHSEQADELAAAFIDKTFDVVFHVNEPVMSDWRSFLEAKLGEAFSGALSDEDVYWVTRFVEAHFNKPGNSERITPRKLIKLINAVSALVAQWSGTIEFTVIAFFVLHRSELEEDVVSFVRKDHDVASVVGDWKRQVVALHFGVPPEKAFQVLLHDPLRSAISELNREEFNRLIQVDGAWSILEDIVSDPPSGTKADKVASRFVANAVILISSSASGSEIPAKRALEILSRLWLDSDDIGALRTDLPDVVSCLGANLPDDLTSTFLSVSMQKLGASLNGTTLDQEAASVFSKTIDALRAVADVNDMNVPSAPLTISADALFQLLGAVPMSCLRFVASDKTSSDIGTALVNALSDEDLSPLLSNAVRALTAAQTISLKDRKKVDWDAVTTAAYGVLQSQPLTHHATGPSIDILGLLHASNENARAMVAQLFDQGRFAVLLDEADHSDDVDLLGDIATLMLLRGSDFQGPSGSSWQEAMDEHEGLVACIGKALAWYRPQQRVMAAINMKPKVPAFAPVIDELTRLEVTENASSFITPSFALANLDDLSVVLGQDLTIQCLSELSKRSSFWDTLAKLPSDRAYLSAVDRLMSGRVVDQDLVLTSIRERLEGAGEEAWSQTIITGTGLFDIAHTYKAHFTRNLLQGDELKRALSSALPDLPQADSPTRTRWFSLVDLLSKNSRTTMVKMLRDRLLAGQEVTDLAGLIKVGGDLLLVTGKFADEADKTSRHVILPLLSDKDGIATLLANASFFGSIATASEPETKGALTEGIEAALSGEYLDDEVMQLRDALNFG